MRLFSPLGVFFSIFVIAFALNFQSIGYGLDTSKYITIDEINPEMEAYCLTVFSGTKVEKFGLKILSIVRNQKPGRDMILVLGTDERFLKTSAVHGCSGSPVYIDGRLAGALAAGWDGSLEPLYLVRPIKDMLEVGQGNSAVLEGDSALVDFDFSQPLNLETSYQRMMDHLQDSKTHSGMLLPVSSSLPGHVIETFGSAFKGAGLMPVASGSLLPSSSFPDASAFEPGGVLALVLCGGDISLTGTGTVTEIIDDQLYGFGHQFQGRGAVNYPIAAGMVHTVVAGRARSFKLSSPGPVLGTLELDQTSAVRGTIGKMPETIDLKIEIDRYNDPERRTYDCYLAVDREMTPLILQVALLGAARMHGTLPLEHTIRYSGQIVADGNDAIKFKNLSSQRMLSDVLTEYSSVLGLLMNNPFEDIKVDSIEIQISLEPDNMTSTIWAVDVSQTKVRPGQTVTASVVLRSYRSLEETVEIELTIPETLPPGRYKIEILGPSEYQAFISGMAPHKFLATDTVSLKTGLNRVLEYRRDRLYAVMKTPSSGLVIRQKELGQLPPTKMLLMQDSKRLIPLEPYKAWTENSITLDRIVRGKAEIEIIVER